ncbi:MAG: hypothetical protein EHM42_04390, partial [Planctomycetaceae bacterium]
MVRSSMWRLQSLMLPNARRQFVIVAVALALIGLGAQTAEPQLIPPAPLAIGDGADDPGVEEFFGDADVGAMGDGSRSETARAPAADESVEELSLEERIRLLENKLRERDAADRKKAEADKKKADAEKEKKAEAVRKKEDEERKENDPRNKKFVTRPFGRIHIDAATFNQDENSLETVGDAENGADIRRARLGVEGEGYGRYFYRFDVDFVTFDQQTAVRPVIVDAYLDIQDVAIFGNIRAGHFREPFSLERLDSTHDLPFLERSLPVNTLAPFRNLGVMSFDHLEDNSLAWAYGVFGENMNELGEEVIDNTGVALTGRMMWNPVLELDDDCYRIFHLGASYSWRHPSRPARRYNQTPEV